MADRRAHAAVQKLYALIVANETVEVFFAQNAKKNSFL